MYDPLNNWTISPHKAMRIQALRDRTEESELNTTTNDILDITSGTSQSSGASSGKSYVNEHLLSAHPENVQRVTVNMVTVDGFIFMGTNFLGLNKNDTFAGFKIGGYSIFFHNSYRKLPFCGYWNSWIVPFTKTMKIGTQRNLSHPQYFRCREISRLCPQDAMHGCNFCELV